MDSPDATLQFQFQCGLDRGSVTVDTAGLTLKTLKEHAFDFLLQKVSERVTCLRTARTLCFGAASGCRSGRGGEEEGRGGTGCQRR